MAKGARASTVKRNNATLRTKIFGPVVDERTARLSAKLQELISKPRPDQERAMEVDEAQDPTSAQMANDMEIDTKSTSTKHKSFSNRKSARIERKTIKKKPKHQVVFRASAGKKKRIAQSKKKSV